MENMYNRLRQAVSRSFLAPLLRKIRSSFLQPGSDNGLKPVVDKNRLYDLQTVQVMQRVLMEDSNCIDVGCHQGDFLKEMLAIAPHGTHFAFEPLPNMVEILRHNFGSYSNVHIFDCALSDSEGTGSFNYVQNLPGYSGLRRRSYNNMEVQIKEITVKTALLDNIVKNTPVRFIKVDVEGAELQVFRGALQTIKNNQPAIVFEHGLGAADFYGTSPEKIFDLLVTDCGLKLFIMAEWLERGGEASLTREAFCQQFSKGLNYYFMAAPA